MIKKTRSFTYFSILKHITEKLTPSPSIAIIEKDNNKPIVKCNIQGLEFEALLDECSTFPKGYVVNYIHVVNRIKSYEREVKSIIKKCACFRSTTCIVAGCFESSTCITLSLHLFDEVYKTDQVLVSCRISKGVPQDLIIGNYTFRDLDLSKVVHHLFISSTPTLKDSEDTHNSASIEGTSNELYSIHEKHSVESILSDYPLGKRVIGCRRSTIDGYNPEQTLLTCYGNLLVESMNERSLGTLWLNNIILSKEDLFTKEEEDPYKDDL